MKIVNDNDNTTFPHDKDNVYNWDQAFDVHVAGLNTDNFAGHSDWRLPNIKELQSIVNYEFSIPAVSDAFVTPCAGLTVLTGSCTEAFIYWSSTAKEQGFTPGFDAWGVHFNNGSVLLSITGATNHVRAVRGGSP